MLKYLLMLSMCLSLQVFGSDNSTVDVINSAKKSCSSSSHEKDHCKRGPTGPQGDQGKQGPRGKDGHCGHVGPTGNAGFNGRDGATGPVGPAGAPGPDGITGPTGATGPDGATGATGEVISVAFDAIFNLSLPDPLVVGPLEAVPFSSVAFDTPVAGGISLVGNDSIILEAPGLYLVTYGAALDQGVGPFQLDLTDPNPGLPIPVAGSIMEFGGNSMVTISTLFSTTTANAQLQLVNHGELPVTLHESYFGAPTVSITLIKLN